MNIGLIADTHSYIDSVILKSFADCDEIWHAGDFGAEDVADQLADIKPLRGVYGNIDDDSIRERFPEDLRFEVEGVDCWVTHIGGRPGRYEPRVHKLLKSNPPDLFICGHSHILHVETDERFSGMQYINPGAAGHHGFHQVRTIMKIRIENGKVDKVRLLELGPRGRRKAST